MSARFRFASGVNIASKLNALAEPSFLIEPGKSVKYRRIEVNAFRRRVTVVSGEWPVVNIDDLEPSQTEDDISLNDTDSCEPVAPDSPEGQVILVEAVRSLESRLSPETRAAMSITPDALAPNFANQSAFCLKLQSLYQRICRKALRFSQKEK